MTSTRDLLTAVVRGDVTEWPASAGRAGEQAFIDAAAAHRVDALIVWRLRRAGTFANWPEQIQIQLGRAARTEALFDAARRQELQSLVSALARAGVGCLLMKGAALAFTCYTEPWLRPRLDADLLIEPGAFADADRVLADLGYRCENGLTGEHVSHQSAWTRVDRRGLRHVLDVHRKISNRPVFADLLPYEELQQQAMTAPAVGARVPGYVHALLLACLHPVMHHQNLDSVAGTYDIHLLAGRLDRSDFDRFTELARRKQVAAICAAGIGRAVERFRTAVPPGVLERLAIPNEPSAAYLGTEAWRGDIRLSDFRALPNWRAQVRFVRDVAFPNADFMLRTYNCTSRVVVPALHVHRLVSGTWRLARRFAASSARTTTELHATASESR